MPKPCFQGFLSGTVVKNLPANARDTNVAVQPWVGKIPWRRKWQPTPVFLPRKFHEQRSLAGYSPWGSKGSDITERVHAHTHTHTHKHTHTQALLPKVISLVWVGPDT